MSYDERVAGHKTAALALAGVLAAIGVYGARMLAVIEGYGARIGWRARCDRTLWSLQNVLHLVHTVFST